MRILICRKAAMSWLAASLQNHPEIALFLVLGVGHAVAKYSPRRRIRYTRMKSTTPTFSTYLL
jgi:hypothetical protein